MKPLLIITLLSWAYFLFLTLAGRNTPIPDHDEIKIAFFIAILLSIASIVVWLTAY